MKQDIVVYKDSFHICNFYRMLRTIIQRCTYCAGMVATGYPASLASVASSIVCRFFTLFWLLWCADFYKRQLPVYFSHLNVINALLGLTAMNSMSVKVRFLADTEGLYMSVPVECLFLLLISKFSETIKLICVLWLWWFGRARCATRSMLHLTSRFHKLTRRFAYTWLTVVRVLTDKIICLCPHCMFVEVCFCSMCIMWNEAILLVCTAVAGVNSWFLSNFVQACTLKFFITYVCTY